jgi:hypothetical protein
MFAARKPVPLRLQSVAVKEIELSRRGKSGPLKVGLAD